ncbi:MAG: hypothetical protein KGI41_02400 [Patescibacteria group bacterium]|nr:hypothetical protein [Patescibacteria group bacterium]MDE1966065.1 hypothetical protein [Patescibacteria group bacterium]
MKLRYLVHCADRREIPETLELNWAKRTGFMPVKDAIRLEHGCANYRLVGYVLCFLLATQLITLFGLRQEDMYLSSGVAHFIGISVGVLIASIVLAFVWGYGRIAEVGDKARYEDAKAFAAAFAAFLEWTCKWPQELPKDSEELRMLADKVLFDAAGQLQEHEASDHTAKGYLAHHGALHAEFTKRHTALVMMGLAVPDWSDYFKSGAKAA